MTRLLSLVGPVSADLAFEALSLGENVGTLQVALGVGGIDEELQFRIESVRFTDLALGEAKGQPPLPRLGGVYRIRDAHEAAENDVESLPIRFAAQHADHDPIDESRPLSALAVGCRFVVEDLVDRFESRIVPIPVDEMRRQV